MKTLFILLVVSTLCFVSLGAPRPKAEVPIGGLEYLGNGFDIRFSTLDTGLLMPLLDYTYNKEKTYYYPPARDKGSFFIPDCTAVRTISETDSETNSYSTIQSREKKKLLEMGVNFKKSIVGQITPAPTPDPTTLTFSDGTKIADLILPGEEVSFSPIFAQVQKSNAFSLSAESITENSILSSDETYIVESVENTKMWQIRLQNSFRQNIRNKVKKDMKALEAAGIYNYQTAENYIQFIDRYGTHYIDSIIMGGSISMTSSVEKIAYQTIASENITLDVASIIQNETESTLEPIEGSNECPKGWLFLNSVILPENERCFLPPKLECQDEPGFYESFTTVDAVDDPLPGRGWNRTLQTSVTDNAVCNDLGDGVRDCYRAIKVNGPVKTKSRATAWGTSWTTDLTTYPEAEHTLQIETSPQDKVATYPRGDLFHLMKREFRPRLVTYKFMSTDHSSPNEHANFWIGDTTTETTIAGFAVRNGYFFTTDYFMPMAPVYDHSYPGKQTGTRLETKTCQRTRTDTITTWYPTYIYEQYWIGSIFPYWIPTLHWYSTVTYRTYMESYQCQVPVPVYEKLWPSSDISQLATKHAIEANQWYDVSIVIDYDSQSYTVWLAKSGDIITPLWVDLPFRNRVTALSKIDIFNRNPSPVGTKTVSYYDEIKMCNAATGGAFTHLPPGGIQEIQRSAFQQALTGRIDFGIQSKFSNIITTEVATFKLKGGDVRYVNLLDTSKTVDAYLAWKKTIASNPVPVQFKLKPIGDLFYTPDPAAVAAAAAAAAQAKENGEEYVPPVDMRIELNRAVDDYLTAPDIIMKPIEIDGHKNFI